MKLYWCSWVCKEDDYRPITYPPNDSIIGWWCSGESGGGYIICAYIYAKNELRAAMAISLDWPEFEGEWRFIEERDSVSDSERFALTKWMRAKIIKMGIPIRGRTREE